MEETKPHEPNEKIESVGENLEASPSPLPPNPEDDDDEIDVEKTSEEELRHLIDTKNRQGLLTVFDHVPTIDISDAANRLTPEELIYIFRNI